MEITTKTTKNGKTVVGNYEIQYNIEERNDKVIKVLGNIKRDSSFVGYSQSTYSGGLNINFLEGFDIPIKDKREIANAIINDVEAIF